MVNGNRVIIYFLLIIIIMSFSIKCSYSQGKPSNKVIVDIIMIMERGNSLKKYTKNMKINNFVVINDFISTNNNRYCVEVNLDVSYEGRESVLVDYKPINDKLINKRYSFEKKGNQWLGWKGWGPGE
jgi:hypothetical protein